MKKNIVIIACIFTSFTHGMETNNSFSIISYGTQIKVTKGSLFDAKDIDLIVIGKNQQLILQKPIFNKLGPTKIDYQDDRIVYEKNKDNESASDDDTYKPSELYDVEKKLWEKAHQKEIGCTVMSITEPQIQMSRYYNAEKRKYVKQLYYYAQRRDPKKEYGYLMSTVYYNKAIKEASKDLIACYKKVLKAGLKKLRKKKEKRIALATLGADVGFPREKAAPIAVKTILQFVKNNPNAYTCIEFFVRKRSDFTRYTELLSQMKKIYLLYCAHNDSGSLISALPHDIINYMSFLLQKNLFTSPKISKK